MSPINQGVRLYYARVGRTRKPLSVRRYVTSRLFTYNDRHDTDNSSLFNKEYIVNLLTKYH